MRIRLGYVSIVKTFDGYLDSKTISYTNYSKDENSEKLENIIRSNLNNLSEILKYNEKNNIHFYRISSNLIPLATKREVVFDYLGKFGKEYEKIGTLIRKNKMRVDMHPSNYCVINSAKKEVVESSFDIIKYHYDLLDRMKVIDKLIILHVGSSVLGKKNAISRFINNFNKLPIEMQKIISIENDDKIFDVEDCLYVAGKLDIPVVLDYHHFKCNNNGSDIEEYLGKIIDSWEDRVPKMHFSSPKNRREFRSHNDYINVDDFIDFINILKRIDKDIDIMLEAKAKDEALFRLVRQLKYKTNYKFIDETSFEV